MEEMSDYKYQTLIDILSEMVKGYLTDQSREKGGENEYESSNESNRTA